ncbi:ABC transporter ATP-binding protein [Novosphingobium sediminicola]|uniref:Capsular polysaccharide transport system ATP-binding protein n=1 Tax=Novosphingobium sediminicola TaxID=563162 RepID=A0A7W6G8X0_9SPHN|nr:ABC transporter ATP-binding protein [Novosphingobium sediminicola]MBB3957838.1 capsular polysaccharide transport system ATP-binding protein [Novosphingobium sediminicola]
MIEFHGVSKTYHTRGLKRRVFSDLSFRIEPGDSLAICGANGAGKSTLLRLIAGVEHPTGGRIKRTMRTSWPIGFTSAFQPGMTGADNARFIARIYQQDEQAVLDYVNDFAQLGVYMNQAVSTYSSGMVSRLAFGVSLAINFDCYLVDEVAAAGDVRFRRRSEEELMKRRDNGTLIMTSHDPYMLEQYCTRGAVLYSGALVFFDTVAEACEVHHALQMRQ